MKAEILLACFALFVIDGNGNSGVNRAVGCNDRKVTNC
jgi:hypothetical protein